MVHQAHQGPYSNKCQPAATTHTPSKPTGTREEEREVGSKESTARQLPSGSAPNGGGRTRTDMEWTTVETGDGVNLNARLFKPSEPAEEDVAVVLVHPYTVLGGVQGLLRGIATGLAERGYRAVTFDMRGAGRSTGRPSLTGFAEVNDVVAVCRWVADTLKPHAILLLGSSAGAPIAGSAVDKVDQVVGYVSIGYPFGLMASILFGRHHNAILRSEKPKLFIMGTKDGFTSVKQLHNKLKSAAGRVETHLIEGAGHFQMEGPAFDAQMVDLVVNFIKS